MGLFYLSSVSHSLFELLVLAQHATWLLFQLSGQLFSASTFSSVVSGISLTNCPYIILFFHSSFFSLSHLCLNSFLFTVSLHSIASAAFMPSINGSTEFLTYHPNCFFPSLYIPHNLRYTLSISFLGCSAPYLVINLQFLLSKLFNSSVFHFRIPAPYVITEANQVLAIVLFLPFNFYLNISLTRRRYSLLNFSFYSFSLILSVSTTVSLSIYNQSH